MYHLCFTKQDIFKINYFFITKVNNCVTLVNNQIIKMANSKKIEKEKVVAEQLNGRFAMIGFIAAVGAYLTTGQIIPGIV